MKNNKFQREIKDIVNEIRNYGLQHTNSSMSEILREKDKNREFTRNVHKGFFIAQRNILRLLTKISNERKRYKTQLKTAKRERNKDIINELNAEIHRNKYQEAVLRRAMDSIAWYLFQLDLSIMKRLYAGEEVVDIADSNIESELSAIEMILQEDPNSFVLISDMTTFIQVGDLVILHPDQGISICELKEGETNKQIFDILDGFYKNEICLKKELADKSYKFIEQFSRNAKQAGKMQSVYNLINTGSGKDLYTNLNTSISQEEVTLQCFDQIVNDLLKECEKKGHAISVIEDCLLIGIYKPDKCPSAIFDIWKESCNIRMPTYDVRSSFFEPFAQPIILWPISENHILKIINGEIIIKMTIDIDKWLETFKEDGYSYRWMGKKQSARQRVPHAGNMIFLLEGQGVELSDENGNHLMIGDNAFTRMFTAFNYPSSIKKLLKKTMEVSYREV